MSRGLRHREPPYQLLRQLADLQRVERDACQARPHHTVALSEAPRQLVLWERGAPRQYVGGVPPARRAAGGGKQASTAAEIGVGNRGVA
eukprot:361422-Chlamydomonas_euryale.AAC.4